MGDIVVVGVFKVAPDKGDAFVAAFRAAIEPTHGEEGCRSYALHQGQHDPATYVLVERWRSQADIDEHFQRPHMQALVPALGDLLAEPPVLVFSEPIPVGDPAKGLL